MNSRTFETADVLLVEDNDGDALIVQELLEELDAEHAMVRARDLAEAQELLVHPDAHFVVALLDVGLPDATELQGVTALHADHPGLAIVVLTGRHNDELAQRALREGAQDFLRKDRLDAEQLDRALRFARERAKQTEGLRTSREELARFAHLVAHDLKSPLASVVGMLDLLDVQWSELSDVSRRDLVQRTQASATRLSELVDSFLALAESTTLEDRSVEVDLDEILAWVQGVLEHDLAAVGATLVVASDLPTVRGAVPGIRQVFLNLVSNAVKYRDPTRDLLVEVHALPPADGRVEVIVEDNGRGVRKEDRESIFELGVRGAHGSGAGVGLSAVRHVVEEHGGKVWVSDPGGHGSRFHVILPVPPSRTED